MQGGARKISWGVIGNYRGMGRMRVTGIWMGKFGGGMGNRGRAMEGREYLCVHEEGWEGSSRTGDWRSREKGWKIGIWGMGGEGQCSRNREGGEVTAVER